MLHRAQILLEEWQYQAVKSQAERQGVSMSYWLRGLLSQKIIAQTPGKSSKKLGLLSIKGIGSSDTSGVDHDSILYGRQS